MITPKYLFSELHLLTVRFLCSCANIHEEKKEMADDGILILSSNFVLHKLRFGVPSSHSFSLSLEKQRRSLKKRHKHDLTSMRTYKKVR